MKCTGNEWDHCRVEKMGCNGCYYNENDIKTSKNWLSALEVNSEFEASSKEYILSYIEQLEKENKTLKQTNKSYKGMLNKQNKIIYEMAKEMYSNISMLEMAKIGQAIDYDPRKMFAGISDEEAIGCIKQYFEKKVGESK